MSVIRTVFVETFIRRCVREGGCGHAVDEIVSNGQRLDQEGCREMRLMKQGDDNLNEVMGVCVRQHHFFQEYRGKMCDE